jgi:restriction system protein
MKNYYRIMLGKKSVYADEAFKGSFIGAGFIHERNLIQHLPENWREFNKEFIPIYLEKHESGCWSRMWDAVDGR